MSKDSCVPVNQLLAALPVEEYQCLIPHLEQVWLPLDQVLYEQGEIIRHVYFPNQAMISLISTLEDGSTTEIGLVGHEGMVGIPVILGGNLTINRAVVQIEGSAQRMDADVLKTEFNRGGALQRLLLLYTQALLTQISQFAVCKSHHTVEKQLARWLLTVHDCVQADELPLTQKFISKLLGIRRASVTVAAGSLQEAGIILYSRGKINILNREKLQSSACECYGHVKAEFTRLLSLAQLDS